MHDPYLALSLPNYWHSLDLKITWPSANYAKNWLDQLLLIPLLVWKRGITHGCDLYGTVNFKLVSFLFSVNQKVWLFCCLQWHFTEASSETKVVVIHGSKTSMIADRNQKEKGQDERVWEILQAHRFNILHTKMFHLHIYMKGGNRRAESKTSEVDLQSYQVKFFVRVYLFFFLKTFIWFSKHFNHNWTKKFEIRSGSNASPKKNSILEGSGHPNILNPF